MIMQTTVVSRGWDPVDGYAQVDANKGIDYPGKGKWTNEDGEEVDYTTGNPIEPEDSPRYGGDEGDSPSDGG